MRIGLHALGIGAGARPEVIRAVATTAEAAGFATLWAGEHVVLVDHPTSRYPYSADGRIAVPADADWLDPLLGLSFVAAATTTIGLATGILLLPEHNPVVAAKQAATLDVLSAGRLTLGVGIGWSAEEFAALGVPFPRRAQRTAEYVAAMRTLWADDPASFTRRIHPLRLGPGQPEARPRRLYPDRARRQQRRLPGPRGDLRRRLVRLQPPRRRGPRAASDPSRAVQPPRSRPPRPNRGRRPLRRHPGRPPRPSRNRRNRASRGRSPASRPIRRPHLGPHLAAQWSVTPPAADPAAAASPGRRRGQ